MYDLVDFGVSILQKLVATKREGGPTAGEEFMKIFALYTNVELVKKPSWLDDFLEKYQPRGLHVTLKQPCYIEDEKVDELKREIFEFFQSHRGTIHVVFDTLLYNKDQVGAIMVCANDARELVQLQKDLCNTLSEYRNYVEKAREEYEKNFMPHITIGDEIAKEEYGTCIGYLDGGCVCNARITGIVLAVVNDMSAKESNDPANKTFYPLQYHK